MEKVNGFRLIGLALKNKTTNVNGQSAIDCGTLWQRFEKDGIFNKIPGKLSNEVFAVYHEYEGDYTKPFSYFIGCKVMNEAEVPEGMHSLFISQGNFQNIKAKGKMPDCVGESWQKIWNSDIKRAYIADFEVYGEKSRDWTNAEIDIFISI